MRVHLLFVVLACAQAYGCQYCAPEASEYNEETWCEGNVQVKHRWGVDECSDSFDDTTRTPCEGVCVTVRSRSFCALFSAPACADRDGAQCDGNLVVDCRDGYLTSIQEVCAATCVRQYFSGTAECATGAPSPLCPPSGDASICVGTELIHCSEGYEVSRRTCGAAHAEELPVCIDSTVASWVPDVEAFCAMSTTADPRCSHDDAFETLGCSTTNTAHYEACRFGFLVKDCGPP